MKELFNKRSAGGKITEIVKEYGATLPNGLTIDQQGGDALFIHHERTGMRSLNNLMTLLLVIFTLGSVIFLHQYLVGGKIDDGESVPLWLVLAMWGGVFLTAGFLIYLRFLKKTFKIDRDILFIKTSVLGLAWSETIPRGSIDILDQVKDGGEGEDSFPSWGLKVEGRREATLISRQPYEVSYWLGEVLSRWADVEFDYAPKG